MMLAIAREKPYGSIEPSNEEHARMVTPTLGDYFLIRLFCAPIQIFMYSVVAIPLRHRYNIRVSGLKVAACRVLVGLGVEGFLGSLAQSVGLNNPLLFTKLLILVAIAQFTVGSLAEWAITLIIYYERPKVQWGRCLKYSCALWLYSLLVTLLVAFLVPLLKTLEGGLR